MCFKSDRHLLFRIQNINIPHINLTFKQMCVFFEKPAWYIYIPAILNTLDKFVESIEKQNELIAITTAKRVVEHIQYASYLVNFN